ncbi:MAG: VIT domain-containing protein [Planctomycetota bacterium]|jgi:tetratricopeptide (TPR) repeat protein
MTDPHLNDDLLSNRLSEVIRGLNGSAYETDDAIEAQLDAAAECLVPADSLTDDETIRILQKMRELIRRSDRSTASPPRPAGRGSAGRPSHSLRPDEGLRFDRSRPARRISLVAAVVALLLTFCSLFQHESSPVPEQAVAGGPALKLSALFQARNDEKLAHYTVRLREPEVALQVGDSVSTGPHEKLRVGLPDGSVAFLNGNSSLTAKTPRTLALSNGEAFFEVQPVTDGGVRSEPFVVQTLDQEVTAVGTKFAVKVGDDQESKVVVTQGSVRLPHVQPVVAAGQEAALVDLDTVVQPSKRASEILSWTRDLVAEATPEIVPKSEHRGGSITVVDPNGQEMKLSMRRFHVDVHIEDGFARTTIDQTYFNHTYSRQEGTFHFPLPPDASLSRLAMYVNGKLMEGGMVERGHGRNVYEQIRHTRRDPALLEWVDGSTFKMRVFPLEARREKRIVLSYTQRLPKNYDRTTYRFPAGHTMEGVREWSTRLRIVDGQTSKLRWFSPSHLLRVIESAEDDESADLMLEGSLHNAAFDRDLVVELEPPALSGNSTRVTEQPQITSTIADGQQYVLLRYQPELTGELTRPKRNWVFVVETSADRNDVLRNAQREALWTVLDNAEHDDTFALITASTRSKSFKARPVMCDAANIESALSFLDETPSLGALDVAAAFESAGRFCKGTKAENWIVHLGSGVGVVGRRDEQTLRSALPDNARYAGIGVGHRWNRSFMRDAASRTGGHFTQINPDEEVSWRAFEFLSALNAPRLLNLTVTSDREDTSFLTFAETIVHGQEVAAVTRLEVGAELPRSITVKGTVDGEEWTRSFPLDFSSINVEETSSHFLPRTWTKLEIDRLVSAGAQQHKSTITELSKSMYVMSPFTSLLVLENEAMYEQFNVDRGRKDHWALYPAPQKIEVVYEPGYSGPQPVDSLEKIKEQLQAASDERDAANSNLQTAEEDRAAAKQIATLKSQFTVAQSKVDRLTKYRDTLQKIRDDELLNAAKPIVDRKPTWAVYQQYQQYWGRQRIDSGLMGINPPQVRVLGENNTALFGNQQGILEGMEQWNFRSRQSALNRWGIVPFGWRNAQLNWDDGAWDLDFDGVNNGLGATSQWALSNTASIDATRLGRFKRFARRPSVDQLSDLTAAVTYSDLQPIRLQILPQQQVEQQIARVLIDGEFAMPGLVSADGYALTDRFLVDADGDGLQTDILSSTPRILVDFEEERLVSPDFGLQPDVYFDWALQGRIHPSAAKGVPTDGNAARGYFYVPLFDADTSHDEIRQVELVENLRLIESNVGLRGLERMQRRRRFATSSWAQRQPVPMFAVTLADDVQFVDHLALLPNVDFIMPEAAGFQEFDVVVPQAAYPIVIRTQPRGGMISDPIERCPGMNTWALDRQAAIDAAAEKDGRIVRGEVSPDAAKLIAKARARGWETVSIPGTDNLNVVVNGAGQFRIERTRLDGLREVIICDGESLWYLYPDFAVGAQRDARLIADSILQSLIPWYVVDVATLSRGANVELIDEHTVRVTPLINKHLAEYATKEGKEAETPLLAVELIFDEAGHLQQKRVVDTRTGHSQQRVAFLEDGKVVMFAGDSRQKTDADFGRSECDAPGLKPDNDLFAILPLPYRAVDKLDIPPLTEKEDGNADFSKLSQTDAMKLIAAYFATGKDTDMYQVMEQCFFAKGEYPLGFATLLHSKNPREVTAIQTATSRHPNRPLSKYLRQAAEWNLHGNPAVEFSLPDEASRYLKMIQATQNIFGRWSSGAAYKDRTGTQTATELTRDLKTISELESSKTIWLLLRTIAEQLPNVGDAQSFLYRKLASTAAQFEERPGQYVSARVQRVKWLLKAGAGRDAARLYAEYLLREADSIASRGGVVILDSEVHESLDRNKWKAAVRAEAKKLIENDVPLAVIALAEACLLVEEVELADELFESVFDADELPSNPRLAAVALPYLTKRQRNAEAEQCFQSLLSHRQLASDPSLWRHASANAKQLGDLDEAARRLEHALQLEFARLPKEINVEQFRTHYNAAFDLLDEAVKAVTDSNQVVPTDLVSRIRELGDRWRSIDADATQPSFRTARLLSELGLPFDAWDYWTSPLAEIPNSSGTWSSLAQELGSRNQVDRASMAWGEAFAWESTNPDHLLNHAQLLNQHGRHDKAMSLLRKISRSKWQPRFEQTRRRAAELLGQ